MKLQWTSHFARAYGKAPQRVQTAFDKHAKKYSGSEDRWQARVNRDWRFYFRIQDDTYILLDIIAHPK